MHTAETISVNPVSKTLGALNPEATLRFLQQYNAQCADALNKKKSFSLMKMIFPSSTPHFYHFATTQLIFRMLFAAILIVSGCFILNGEITAQISIINEEAFAIVEIISGSFLALGLFTRPAMAAMAVLFAISAVMQYMEGVIDMQSAVCCLIALLFMAMGAGRFSSDFLIRKSILIRRKRKENQIRENRLSYRAYRIQNM